MGRRRKQRARDEALVALGVRVGRKKALEDALEVTARQLFTEEEALVKVLLEETTPEQALDLLPTVRDRLVTPRWAEVMRPLLADIIRAQV